MRSPFGSRLGAAPSLPFVALCLLLAALWLAGGASRADVLGQAVVRFAAAVALITTILFGPDPQLRRFGPVVALLGAALTLTLIQLVPLPPMVWQSMPGRTPFAWMSEAAGAPGLWRPLSLVPGATLNASLSLSVPVAFLVLLSALNEQERAWLPGVLLALIAASAMLGLLQFSGGVVDNPLINDVIGDVAGPFANRNHFALLLACGLVLTPAWTFQHQRRSKWRPLAALVLMPMLGLMVLATGSRAGLVLAGVAVMIGVALSWRSLRAAAKRQPRWVPLATGLGAVMTALVLVSLSILAGRAMSIERLLTVDPGQDMRSLGLPTVLQMVRTYLPWGAGLGGFDPIFRMHEPLSLLKPTYFNHAHDDLLEIILDGGVPATLLLLAALAWWLRASWSAWRRPPEPSRLSARLGSAILLLIFAASAFDYPARTPLIMAVGVIAAMWLADRGAVVTAPALPGRGQGL